ncbi:protein S100-A1-like [Cheilinus undulatus]|uniref:protein S100-A1-like n=1 Tax=Cheilinus undulatus TaxID=241271 RepID=UPI001BD375B8|nr:protein S100-A1-like [Cheilinus undulatus]XP_041648490.1 protein S100-A1-like [Cheilinus undulatus]
MELSLQQCLDGLIKVFYSYSGKEGDKYTMSKAELKLLLEEQMGDSIAANINSSSVDKFMHELDRNRDTEVDFKEFVYMVTILTIACHEFFR